MFQTRLPNLFAYILISFMAVFSPILKISTWQCTSLYDAAVGNYNHIEHKAQRLLRRLTLGTFSSTIKEAQAWPDGNINCLIFGHLEQWKFAQEHFFFAKVGSKFAKYSKKLFKNSKYF